MRTHICAPVVEGVVRRVAVLPAAEAKREGGMTLLRREWVQVAQLEQALWPHGKFPDEAMMVQYTFVENVPLELALAAVKSLATREHPPNAAMIAEAASRLASPELPGWDEVRPALMRMIRRGFGADRAPQVGSWEAAGYHPILAAFFTPARWRQWCLTDEGDTTFNAQQRDEYRLVCGRSEKEFELLSAGVDRAEIQRGPHRLDPLAALRLVSGGES